MTRTEATRFLACNLALFILRERKRN